jgi:predicted RNA-binding protein YlqC (UPF0109 family)
MSCSDLTYEQPINNRLGDFGIRFPVGKVLWIADADDAVTVSTTVTEDQIASEIKAGSGDFGLALFRRGKTYTITAGEKTIIDAAGYSDCTSA